MGTMTTRIAFAAVCGASLLAASPDAHAEGPTSALSWVRLPDAEACIGAQELGERIERRLNRAVLVSPSIADVSLEGRAERLPKAPRRYRAVVNGTRRDGTTIGERTFVSRGDDCREIDDGLVLAIALMIDPDAIASPAPPPPPPPPPAAPLPPPIVVRERVVVKEVQEPARATRPSGWLVDGAVLGLLTLARTPETTRGLSVGVRLGPSRALAFEASLGTIPSTTLALGFETVTYTLIEGGLGYCPTFALASRFELGAAWADGSATSTFAVGGLHPTAKPMSPWSISRSVAACSHSSLVPSS